MMDVSQETTDQVARRGEEILDALSDFLHPFLEGDTEITSVLLALAWCLGYYVEAFPVESRQDMRDMVDEEIDGIVATLEEEGMAGTLRVMPLH